jgi:serine/threonine-protein kinase
LGIVASAFAMACSFGEIDEDTTPGNEDPAPGATTEPTTGATTAPTDNTGSTPPPTGTTVRPGTGGARPPSMIEAQAIGILQLNCSSCHGAANYANINYITDPDALIANGKIIEGDASNSPIYIRLSTNQMPPIGVIDQRPSAGDIEVIKLWIDGMKDIPKCSNDGAFVDFDTLFATMLADINTVDADERVFMRYISVANAFNAGACGVDLEREQYALYKVVNHLSTEAQITPPYPVDSRGLLYRVDMRDYNWNRAVAVKPGFSKIVNGAFQDQDPNAVDFADLWEAAVATAAPYNVEFTGDDADELKRQTGTLIPVIQSDAFIEAAMTNNLYYAFIDVPDTFAAFEAQLGVDEQEQIDELRLLRAGFETSGVSKQERIVDRFELDNQNGGSLWVSYDFADNGNQNQSIYSDPLGRNQAGGEMIFNLPNGLQGYYVAANDAQGNRLTEAPVDVVVDPSQVKNLGAVTNGISCMSCHQDGIIQFTDTVREWVLNDPTAYDAETFDLVRDLYPTNDDMLDVVNEDKDYFQVALEESGVPLDIADPADRVFLDFEVAPVLVNRAAGDLGVTPKLLVDNLARLDPRLRNVERNGIDRELFKVVYADSICQLQVFGENTPLNVGGAPCP